MLGKRLASGETVADLIKEGHAELVFEYGKLVANQKAYQVDALPPAKDLPDVCGVWIVGPPRTGKSHYVRNSCGYASEQILVKNCNKWFNDWDPLKHKVVLLDDLDKSHSKLGHYLKIWADKYPFQAEVKGSTMASIRPEQIYVTSNYSISELFGEDPTLVDALQHRFKCIDARAWKQWSLNANQQDWQKFQNGVTYWDRTMWINGVLQPGSDN